MKICVYVFKLQYLSLSRLPNKQRERALHHEGLQTVKKGWRDLLSALVHVGSFRIWKFMGVIIHVVDPQLRTSQKE